MSLWRINSPEYPEQLIGKLDPIETLVDFEGPKTFSFKLATSQLAIAHFCDEEDESPYFQRFIISPTTEASLKKLKRGVLSVREVLDQAIVWVADVDGGRNPIRAWSCTLKDLPQDAAPSADTMLRADLEPLISLRAIGPDIKLGSMPADVLRHIVEAVEGTFKNLLDHFLQLHGRPSNEIRRFYSLEAQHFAFKSLEISFRTPGEPQPSLLENDASDARYAFEQAKQALREGLEWVASEDLGLPLNRGTQKETLALLRALKSLTPSGYGPIKELQVRGMLLPEHNRSPVRLNGANWRRIRQVMQHQQQTKESYEAVVARVGSIDRDRFACILRRRSGDSAEIRVTFSPDLFDEMLQALTEDVSILATIRESEGQKTVVAVADPDEFGSPRMLADSEQ